MKIAYITSSSFSGSTLLSFILNSHPKIGTISEFDVMSMIRKDQNYLCSCGVGIRQCAFFQDVRDSLREQGVEFEFDDMNLMFNVFPNERLNRYYTQKIPFFNSTKLEDFREGVLNLFHWYSHFMSNMHSRNKKFMDAVVKFQDAEIFLDANKNPYRIKRLAEQHEVYPIYVYKNGIAGVYSFFSKKHARKRGFTFDDACTIWFKEQITINRVITDSSPNKALSISYSEMCNATQEVADRIYNFCGLEPQSISNFYSVPHHIIGNTMRVKSIDKIVETRTWENNVDQKQIDIYLRAYDRYMPKLLSYNKEIEQHIWNGK